MLIEMTIKGLMVDPITNMPIVILKDKEGERVLPIWVGIFEANAIALQIENVSTPRPMTHDLLRDVIHNLNGDVQKIVVSDLKDNTFYAVLHVLVGGQVVVIDARPSDAIALAVRSQVPIYAEDTVLDKAGVQMDMETGEPIVPRQDSGEPRPLREEELKSLSAFSDFIGTLNLEDLGKGESPSTGGTDTE